LSLGFRVPSLLTLGFPSPDFWFGFFSRSGATAVSGDDVLRSSLDFRHRHANRDSISSRSTRQRSPEGTLCKSRRTSVAVVRLGLSKSKSRGSVSVSHAADFESGSSVILLVLIRFFHR
jgi:hypothetical protein